MDSRRTYEWSEREDAVLGTMADVAVGELLGTSEAMVRVRRRALGIPPSKEPLDPTRFGGRRAASRRSGGARSLTPSDNDVGTGLAAT